MSVDIPGADTSPAFAQPTRPASRVFPARERRSYFPP